VNAESKRVGGLISAVLVAAAAALWVQVYLGTLHVFFAFDDAYMFYRYAMNVRHGLGVSWNLDGVHTYGMTSLLWQGVVLLLSYLPVEASRALQLGSLACTGGAMVAMAHAVARNARGEYMANTLRVLPMVVLPLTFVRIIPFDAINGMETMLGALLCAVFLGLALAWVRGAARPEVVGLAGVLLYFTRPEAAILVVLTPVLLYALTPEARVRSLLRLLGVFVAGVLLQLLICKLYFHTALPLSFYMKSWNGYEGYSADWHPVHSAYRMLLSCWLYFMVLIFMARRSDWRLLVACFVPVLPVFLYLMTVTQVMGAYSRYYVPYYAFFLIPALLVLDRRIADWTWSVKEMWSRRELVGRSIAALVLLGCFCFQFVPSKTIYAAEKGPEKRCTVYDPVQLQTAATMPLPKIEWSETIARMGREILRPLPRGTTVAASEVGYLGAVAPQVNLIDLEGLNDTEIALHGFTVSGLLARRPDMIWMPHTDYSYQNGLILSSPELLKEYEVLAGAVNSGIAIRKDSPVRIQLEERIQRLWVEIYPQSRMSEDWVQSAEWTGQKHLAACD
jgi:hypothetical protein